MFEYKGYYGKFDYQDGDECFNGEVIGLDSDGIHFAGKTPDELKQAFVDSVDTYLDYCKTKGRDPERAYSGKIPLRIRPDIHRRFAIKAKAEGTSVNKLIEEVLDCA